MRAIALCTALLTGCIDDGRAPEHPPGDDPAESDEPAPAPAGEFAAFMACLQYADFVAADLAGAWSRLGGHDRDAACTTCHREVEYGDDPAAFFEALATRTYYQLRFFAFESGEVVVNETTIPRVGKASVPYTEHSRFDTRAVMEATRTLHALTKARLATGSCP